MSLKFQLYKTLKRVGLLVIVSLFCILSKPVSAQDVTGSGMLHLLLSPSVIDLVTEPGKSITTQIKVQNEGTAPENLQMGLLKFKADGTNGQSVLMDREAGDDFFDWITFSEDKLIVNPGEWKSVTVTFNPPSNASLGYYYAFTVSRVSEVRPAANGAKQTSISGMPAILALVEVKVPNEKRELSITEFTTDKKLYEYLPTSFKVTVKNSGNVHLIPSGSIFVDKGGSGVDAANIDINPSGGNILPNSIRVYEAQWEEGFPAYSYKMNGDKRALDADGNPVKILNWDFNKISKIRIGKYTAHVIMAYDDGQKDVPMEGVVTFWVIPWKLILISVLVLALLGFGLFHLFKPVARAIFKRRR